MIRDRSMDSMEHSSATCNSSRLLTFLIGAAAGAAVALLFAPAPGRKSRAWLKDGARRVREGAEDRYDRAHDALDAGTAKVRGAVEDGASKLRGAVESGRDVLRETVAATKEGYARAREEHEATGLSSGNRKA
jgi:gas vesicle protein